MAPGKNSPIGIIDSGMGGISIWTEIVRTMPREDVVYWADSANCPYGGRNREEIVSLVRAGVETLVREGVKIIVIACNTATTAAIDTLRHDWPEMTFVGLEPAVKPAARSTRSGVIGVLGTAYTVNSEMFRRTAERYASGVRIIATAGNGLVEQVENGRENTPETEALLRKYIEPMLKARADRLVLACTHYPLLTEAIRKIVGNREMEIIDPAPAIARHTLELLRERDLLTDHTAQGRHHFLSSGTEDDISLLKARAERYKNNNNETGNGKREKTIDGSETTGR